LLIRYHFYIKKNAAAEREQSAAKRCKALQSAAKRRLWGNLIIDTPVVR